MTRLVLLYRICMTLKSSSSRHEILSPGSESSGEVIMEDPVKPIEEELVYLRDEFAATKEVRDEHSKMSALYHQLQSKCKGECVL